MCGFSKKISAAVSIIYLKAKSSLNSKDFRPLKINIQLFPLFFAILFWLIYHLNIILNGDFEPAFLPFISFFKKIVAENVAKSFVGWYQMFFTLTQD